MTTPFDALASSYHALWSDTPRGRQQREAVWREIDGLFRAGDRVLDLGCGTGDDALHLAGLGVEVLGIDAAPKMVEVARNRGVNASVLAIEHLDSVLSQPFSKSFTQAFSQPLSQHGGADPLVRAGPPGPAPRGCARADQGVGCGPGGPPHLFSGALSNFGALNCVADLRPVAAELAHLIQPAGPVAICVMGRFCLTDSRHAPKRWIGHTRWRGVDVYYPTSRQIHAAFAPGFAFERRISIARGDHQLYIFRRRTAC